MVSGKTDNIDVERGTKEAFTGQFEHEQASLIKQLDRLKIAPLSDSGRANLVTQCLSGISHLSNEFREAASYLPAHDRRAYSTAIKTLIDEVEAARSASAPRRKFTFKKPVSHIASASNVEQQISSSDSPDSTSLLRSCRTTTDSSKNRRDSPLVPKAEIKITGGSTRLNISSLSSTIYVLQESALKPAASVTNVVDSYVDLSISMALARPFATLTIKDVSKSLLFCTRISGAAHVTNAQNSTFIIWSRQLRMHDCDNCVVYLHCSSRPIIESCTSIRFAPLPVFIHPQLEGSYNSPSTNLWDQVDDFKWIKAEDSPNWSVLLPEDKYAIESDGWKKIMTPQKSQLELDNLLKAGKVVE